MTEPFNKAALLHAANGLATPGMTVIIITADGNGVTTSICGNRPQDLVHAAVSLLRDAGDMLDNGNAQLSEDELESLLDGAKALDRALVLLPVKHGAVAAGEAGAA